MGTVLLGAAQDFVTWDELSKLSDQDKPPLQTAEIDLSWITSYRKIRCTTTFSLLYDKLVPGKTVMSCEMTSQSCGNGLWNYL